MLLRELKKNHYMMFCPGCQINHQVWVIGAEGVGPRWDFDGNFNSPTFSPSLRVAWPQYDEVSGTNREMVCHSFIKRGEWEFLSDCTHDLAGKRVPMVDLDTVPL